MNTGRILCKAPVQGEYITAGMEYTFWQHGNTFEYKRADGAGSYMKKFFWEKALKDGNIEILQG